ncbi:MAG: glycosyl hydrolase family 28-related protein [Cyanobacteria bacterium P01_D01_bin.56]
MDIYGTVPANFGDTPEIIFPDDSDIVINVQAFGATGDGISDDTEVIQNAIYAADRSSRALYFPNGQYRITRELRFVAPDGRPLTAGPYLFGQSRDGVVLKLDDRSPGFGNADNPNRAIIRAVHVDDGVNGNRREISADQFNRFIVNLTLDVGDNPGAVGIKFYSNNTGVLQNVRIMGDGAVGLDVGTVGLNGPNLIQNLEVDGFDIGIRSDGPFGLSSTLSNITVRNASAYGIYNVNQVLQVEGLTVENAPVAVFTAPTHQARATTLTLINGTFTGSDPTQPAIINGDVLFARNITTSGYSQVLQDETQTGLGDVLGTQIGEYSSHGVSQLFADRPGKSLNLTIRYSPLTYDPNPDNWVSVKDYGALPGDTVDDTDAIRAAVGAAIATNKTTVYFPGDASPDPNWYILEDEIAIHGSVSHLLGFAPARILGDGGFKIIDDESGPDLVQIQGFSFSKIKYENASSRALSLRNLTGTAIATGSGETYLNSVAGQLSVENPKAHVWARQLNTEASEDGLNVVNNGGTLWLLGHKTEQGGIKSQTLNGGQTEILGAQIYALGAGDFETIYQVIDSEASFAGVRENTNTRKYANFVQEVRNGKVRWLDEGQLPAGGEYRRAFSLYSTLHSGALVDVDETP